MTPHTGPSNFIRSITNALAKRCQTNPKEGSDRTSELIAIHGITKAALDTRVGEPVRIGTEAELVAKATMALLDYCSTYDIDIGAHIAKKVGAEYKDKPRKRKGFHKRSKMHPKKKVS